MIGVAVVQTSSVKEHHMNTQLILNSVQFSVFTDNNQIWLTSSELTQVLCNRSDDSIARIYNRNHKEFSARITEKVNLTVSVNYKKQCDLSPSVVHILSPCLSERWMQKNSVGTY